MHESLAGEKLDAILKALRDAGEALQVSGLKVGRIIDLGRRGRLRLDGHGFLAGARVCLVCQLGYLCQYYFCGWQWE